MDSAREETGYKRYNLNKKDTFAGMPDRIHIEHLEGPSKGNSYWLRRDIALELIETGKAREVK
jgi:hypothetical protein